jgi:hypothetical protein
MTPVYLQARLKLKYGQVPAFMDTMTKARPLVEKHGWTLIGAWATVIGNFHEVTHLWQIADADAVPTVLGRLAVDPTFGPLVGGFAEQVEEEVLTVLTKTPYSP